MVYVRTSEQNWNRDIVPFEMRFLRFVFGATKIYSRRTLLHTLVLCVEIFIIIFIASAFLPSTINLPSYTYPLICIVVGWVLLRSTFRTLLARKYLKQYPESLFIVPSTEIVNSSAEAELGGVDHLKPVASYGDANIYLATFDFFQTTKYGKYLAKQAYYTVLAVQLIRQLPHVLFDSKTAKTSQFKKLYLNTQKINVQGIFDDVFDTYVPQNYAIDSLSFISPEVMEVLLDASVYDIEIIDNKVLLYAPLLDKDEFDDLLSKGKKIAKQLNDNIDTYRDDRLNGNESKTSTTLFARSLLKSPQVPHTCRPIGRSDYWYHSYSRHSTTKILVQYFMEPALIFSLFYFWRECMEGSYHTRRQQEGTCKL